jgi:diacylglycerol kinase family enzyme
MAGFLLSARLRPGMTPSWIRRIRTKELHIDGPTTVRIETDGELAGELPAFFSISEKSLPLIVP